MEKAAPTMKHTANAVQLFDQRGPVQELQLSGFSRHTSDQAGF